MTQYDGIFGYLKHVQELGKFNSRFKKKAQQCLDYTTELKYGR